MEKPKATLTRLEFTDAGTFGELVLWPYGLKFVSGELPWAGNEPGVSCIPVGTYECVWTFSPRFSRPTYLLKDVPGRSAIRIHSANFCGSKSISWLRSQLDGCLTLGSRIAFIDKQQSVIDSAPSVRLFENTLKGVPFDLEVLSRVPVRLDNR